MDFVAMVRTVVAFADFVAMDVAVSRSKSLRKKVFSLSKRPRLLIAVLRLLRAVVVLFLLFLLRVEIRKVVQVLVLVRSTKR